MAGTQGTAALVQQVRFNQEAVDQTKNEERGTVCTTQYPSTLGHEYYNSILG